MNKLHVRIGRVVVAAVMVTVLLAVARPTSAAGETIGFSPAAKVVNVGDTYNVDVVVDTAGTQIRGYQFGLTYDSTKVEVISFVAGTGTMLFDWAAANPPASAAYTPSAWIIPAPQTGTIAPVGVSVAGGSGGPASGGAHGSRVAKLTLKALAATSGGSAIQLTNVVLNDQFGDEIAVAVNGGTMWQGEVPPTPDLVIDSLTLQIDPGNAANYKVEATVKNVGGAATGGESNLQVKVDGTTVQDFTVADLAAGASASFVTTSYTTLTDISDNIGVCADSAGAIPELDEGNNCASTVYSLVSDAAEDATDVEADLKKYISIRAPSDVPHTEWNLTIGPNTKGRSGPSGLGVKSNANWVVTAADEDTTNTNGKMKEWNGTSFGTNQLHENHAVYSGSYTVPLPTAATIRSGVPNTTTGWQDFYVTFGQGVSFDDIALDATWYRIVVTFAGTTTF